MVQEVFKIETPKDEYIEKKLKRLDKDIKKKVVRSCIRAVKWSVPHRVQEGS